MNLFFGFAHILCELPKSYSITVVIEFEESAYIMVNNGVYNKAIYWPKEVRKMVKRTLEWECTIYPTQHMYDRLENYDLPMDI